MGGNIEKRIFKRHNHKAIIICAYFNTNKYCRAKMLNYCEGGLYFESEFPFKPRSCIYIRLEEFSPITSGSPRHCGARTTTLGEVQWCKELSGTESIKYGIGVRYYEPY